LLNFTVIVNSFNNRTAATLLSWHFYNTSWISHNFSFLRFQTAISFLLSDIWSIFCLRKLAFQLHQLLLLQNFLVFERYYLNKLRDIKVPVDKYLTCLAAVSIKQVLAEQLLKLKYIFMIMYRTQLNKSLVAEVVEVACLIQNIGYTTTHTGSKVSSCRTYYYYTSTGHVFTTVVSYSFDNSYGSRVTYPKAFTCYTVNKQTSCSGSVKHCITNYYIFIRFECRSHRRYNDYFTSLQTFTQVVICITFKPEADTLYQEGSEALTC